jgi:hypothetical protein
MGPLSLPQFIEAGTIQFIVSATRAENVIVSLDFIRDGRNFSTRMLKLLTLVPLFLLLITVFSRINCFMNCTALLW